MRNPDLFAGEVLKSDFESGRLILRCEDGTYARVLLSQWARVREGMRLTWVMPLRTGYFLSPDGYTVDYDFAVWGLTLEAAEAWFAKPRD